MKAEDIYVDPSGLAKLYISQPGSREMARWRGRLGGALAITHHGRLEIANAIGRAVFLGFLDGLGGDKAFGNFALDFTEGRLVQPEILWRAALNRGVELSRKYSPRMGTRSADVLHVACALELKLRHFLTFDERQKDLAIAVGLKAVNPLI